MKLLTLEEWIKTIYSSDYPSLQTLQRWARNGNIYPPPEKLGKQYRVREDAIYIDPLNYSPSYYKSKLLQFIDKTRSASPVSLNKKR
ncbi:excisionase [Serratia fonticola]|uniref:excisionase n=1 Tax=Serratia fonticola TaxID=47917 RepID=UPI003AF39AAC